MPVPHRQLLLLNVCLNSLRHWHSIRISQFVQFRVRTGRARRQIRDATDVTARDPTSINRRETRTRSFAYRDGLTTTCSGTPVTTRVSKTSGSRQYTYGRRTFSLTTCKLQLDQVIASGIRWCTVCTQILITADNVLVVTRCLLSWKSFSSN